MGFTLAEVSCLRVLDHAHIDDLIQRRKQWREITQQRWVNSGKKYATILRRQHRAITEKNVTDLHALANKLLSTSAEFKLVVSLNQGYVYTNDLDLIEQLTDMPELTCKTYTQARVSRPKNTIQLKNPKHGFRTYLKLLKLTVEQKDQLSQFLSAQQAYVRLSPALLRWLQQSFHRTQDYFFIEHDTENWLTMLSLVQPGIIRKTMHIITAK
jgi:hypothetical protein